MLSGAVFVMGLLAGYDITHESQNDARKTALDYPVPAAPPAPATTPLAVASASVAPTPTRAAPPQLASNPKPAAAKPAASPPEETDLPPEPAAPPPEPAIAPKQLVSNPPPAPVMRHKPFNIEIQAAMDSASAGQMIQRLRALGYQPRTIPTAINGTTWYKVQVGPYSTQEEAAAAEATLRQRYNTAYGKGGAPAEPGDVDPSSDQGRSDE
jgi:septal ring-binding cell division protein DamX